MIGFRHAGRPMGNAGRVHDRVDPLQSSRQVLWPGQVADDRAGAVELHLDRTPQQHADEVPAPGELANQVTPDEPGRPGDRYKLSNLLLLRHRSLPVSNETQISHEIEPGCCRCASSVSNCLLADRNPTAG